MKRNNHSLQGLLFVVACCLIGLLAYQALTGHGAQTSGNTQTAIGNSEETYTMVTEMPGTPDSELDVSNTAESDLTVEDLGPAQESEEARLDQLAEKHATPHANGGNCEARVLRRVTAIDNNDAVMEVGETWSSITQFWHNERTDDMWYCGHGSYCYPAWIRENGVKVKAIELTNCSVLSDRPERDGDETMYPVGQ